MYAEWHTVVVTTDADGDAEVYTLDGLNGRVLAIEYVDTDLDSGADFTITIDGTGEGLWTETNAGGTDKIVYPKKQNHDLVGAALASNFDYQFIADDRVKIVIAQGGNVKTGTFRILVG